MITLNCKNCSKEFRVRDYRKNTAHFCSRECAYTDKERAEKTSERIKNNPIPNSDKTVFQKGHVGYKGMLGKQHTKETKKKLGDSLKGRRAWNKGLPRTWEAKPFPKGHTPWNKGIGTKTTEVQRLRVSKEYKLWRIAVFERDNYTCIWCGQRGGTLNADHIKRFADFPELRFAIDNGRTLCLPCHKTTGTWGRIASA
jgi:hypothetical protein